MNQCNKYADCTPFPWGRVGDGLYSFDAYGRRRNATNWSYTLTGEPALFADRGFTGHEHLAQFGLVNMNGRLYDPVVGRFLSPDNYVQDPGNTQNFNRYGYCMNNPLRYNDQDGEFWHIVAGAVIGGAINLAMNWDNCDGFWEYAAAFGVGAAGGAVTAAVGGADGGASFWAITGTAALAGGITSGTNNIIAQTGTNFSGSVNWGQVGINSAVGLVAGGAGGAAGYWAANSSFVVNGINSPLLRSAVVSPIAAGAGHVAGGTAAGWFQGQSLGDAFLNSFNGIGQSMAMGLGIGVASTIGVSYAKGINPWTGKALTTSTSLHATERSIERNVNQNNIDDALKNPLQVSDIKYDSQGRASVKYIGKGATVIVNPETGKIITVYPTSTQRLNSILNIKK